jgi:two-component system CheB/CheR fusion protein
LTKKSPKKTRLTASASPTVLAIACSAEPPDSLHAFLAALPATPDCVIVAAVQDPPSPPGKIPAPPDGLPLPVAAAKAGTPIRPGRIHLVQPGSGLTVRNGKFAASPGGTAPLDSLLSSIASEFGPRAVAVVLSGTGCDGARGARAVKEAGGFVLVESPESAPASGMPEAAILSGAPDFTAAPAALAAEFAHLAALEADAPPAKAGTDPASERMRRLESTLKRHTGFDLSDYKPETASRRIARRMVLCRIPDFGEYTTHLQRTPAECDLLANDMLIGVTSFFRDRAAFDRLRETVIPGMVRAARGRTLRVWCAGCSTGEEVYTLAMLIDHALEELGEQGLPVKIFATDLDRRALAIASQGTYPSTIAESLPPGFAKKYFTPQGGHLQIARHIRERIVFARHNLLKDPPFIRLDLLCCRNLLIYLRPHAQQRALSIMHFSLRHEGALMLGSSETLGELQDDFGHIDSKHHLFFKKTTSSHFSPDPIRFTSFCTPALPPPGTRPESQLPPHLDEALASRILANIGSACFVLNDKLEILYSFGDTARYAAPRQGRASIVLADLLPKNLSLALSNAASKASSTGKPFRYTRLKAPGGSGASLVVETFQPANAKRPLLLVFIDDRSKKSAGAESEFGPGDSMQRISELEEDLRESRAGLKAAIEALEATNEELQTTNEELHASNEELHSTNEELESLNEELQTLNIEHQTKIKELTKARDDLDNFISSSDIATLFLDTELNIRRFTPAAACRTGLLPHDTGRNISALAHPLLAAAAEAAREVLSGAERAVRRLPAGDGGTILLRASPFLLKNGNRAGATITFIALDPAPE